MLKAHKQGSCIGIPRAEDGVMVGETDDLVVHIAYFLHIDTEVVDLYVDSWSAVGLLIR